MTQLQIVDQLVARRGTDAAAPDHRRAVGAKQVLKWSARAWFAVAFAGQVIFFTYVLLLYTRVALSGDPTKWNTVMPHGYVPGETFANVVVVMHVFFAALITSAGLLQLIPAVRMRAPAAHRWIGRVYIATAFAISLGGLYMVWGRGSVGDLSQHISISLNGLIIMVCAAVAWHHAREGRVGQHRRWALRLFMVVSGVWFFRIGLMFWVLANRGPAGFDPERFVGPALTVLSFSTYLVPLSVLELYLRAQDRGGATIRLGVAGLIGVLTLATAVGVVGATIGMWLPRV